MARVGDIIHGLTPVTLMILTQAAMAGVNVAYKLAGNIGTSLKVLIAYRFIIASAVIVPIALFLERKTRPKLTWTVMFHGFLCGLLGGSLAQNMYAQSLVLTSATFVAAMLNLAPAITFILGIAFKMEKLGLHTMAGKAKVLGTSLCIGGAMLLTFYKGVKVNLWSTNIDLLKLTANNDRHGVLPHHVAGNHDHMWGVLLIIGCCFSTPLGLIVQAKMVKDYPCPYSSTALMVSMGALQASVYALCSEKDWSQWKLGWNLRLLIVSYSGIVASGLMFTVMMWCVQKKGPLYVAIFNPLMLVLVAIAGSILLEEQLHLGSVMGGVIIVLGLYVVLWGKGKELKKISQLVPSKGEEEEESDKIEIVIGSPSRVSKSFNNRSERYSITSDGILMLFDDGRSVPEVNNENKLEKQDNTIGFFGKNYGKEEEEEEEEEERRNRTWFATSVVQAGRSP